MYALREVVYNSKLLGRHIVCLLAADIGGTNSNFGFFVKTPTSFELVFSLHAKSQEIINFADLVKEVLAHALLKFQTKVTHACFAGAGVVSEARDVCKPTNLNFTIRAQEILEKTSLTCALIANDFEVIGYGISKISPEKLVLVHPGKVRAHANRGIIGAGTGLGKCSLLWHEHVHRYMPLASEGGHADFPAQHQEEYDLIEFIRNQEQRSCTISWEDVLSGNGIKRIYNFYQSRNKAEPSHEYIVHNGLHPDTIFRSRTLDVHAYKTYKLYQKIYARCAKNFALDALALAGLYIAGGIAANNIELFKEPDFMREFLNCGKQQDLLAEIPLIVIADYNVSLYGAVAFMALEGLC